MRRHLATLIVACWMLLVFLLSFRWCYAAVSVEQANYPLSLLEWVFITLWPQSTLSLLTGVLLVSTVALWPKLPSRFNPATVVIPLLALSPLLFGLTGWVNTTEIAYATHWYWHFFNAAAIAGGIWWCSQHDQRLLPGMLHVIAIATAINALMGWHQYFGGIEAEFKMQLENARELGQQLPEQFVAKMQQKRVYGAFADPNIYAGHLLLTAPALLYSLWQLGGRCAQPRVCRWLFIPLAIILLGGAILMSGSRGAVVGIIAAIGVILAVVMLPKMGWKTTAAIALLAVLLGVGAVLGLSRVTGRKLETLDVRMEYYATSWKIIQRFPIVGAGLGEFFPWHMRLKSSDADEARDPHSLLFAMLTQCGIAGGIDALLRLGLPFLLALGVLRKYQHQSLLRRVSFLAGWCAWNTHALVQFNDMVMASAAFAAFIGLFAFDDAPKAPATPGKILTKAPWLPAGVLAIAGVIALVGATNIPREKYLQELENSAHSNTAAAALPDSRLYTALEKAWQDYPAHLMPPRLAMDVALNNGQDQFALKAAQAMVARTPHRASSWCRLARCQMLLGHVEQAATSLENAKLWYPNSPDTLYLSALMQNPPSTAMMPVLCRARTSRYDVREGLYTVQITLPTVPFHIRHSAQTIVNALSTQELHTNDGRKVQFILNPSTYP